jgi:glucose/arabinose dehydrogenase
MAVQTGMTVLRSSALALGLAGLAAGPLLLAQTPAPKRDVAKVWTEVCASCHGPNMQGAQAPSMLDDVWTTGNTDAALAVTIKNGRVANGMPAFGTMLNDEEIRAMVVYIRETAGKAKAAGATHAAPAPNVVVTSEKHAFKLETVVEGVTTPWGLDFLPDGRMLITEKGGALRIADAKGTLAAAPVQNVPAVWSKGQGGLLDVAVHPDYAKNGWIYISYSDPGEGDSAMTAIIRAKLTDNALTDIQPVFKVPAALYKTANVHFGTRFVFDGKGHVFFSIGDRGHQTEAQDVTRPNGKVHRINEDGTIPKDNPFVDKADAVKSIWSYGHRNPQGLAQHPTSGALYDVEHGPRGGDELNLVVKGKNYGWPVITYGMNYNGTPMTDKTAAPGMEQPLTYWVPSIAVSSIGFYTGTKFPGWKNSLFLGSLAAQELRRLEVNGTQVKQEVLFKNVGRLRDVVMGPDGAIYVAFNQPDRIARLVPAQAPATSAAR